MKKYKFKTTADNMEEDKEKIKLKTRAYYNTLRERMLERKKLKTKSNNPKSFRLPKEVIEKKGNKMADKEAKSTIQYSEAWLLTYPGLDKSIQNNLPKGTNQVNPWGWGEYYGEPEVKVASCNHEYVNVGFHHDKWVCNKCNEEKPKDEA